MRNCGIMRDVFFTTVLKNNNFKGESTKYFKKKLWNYGFDITLFTLSYNKATKDIIVWA